MIKKIKNYFLALASSLALLAPALAMPVAVHAAEPDLQGSLCTGADLQLGSPSSCVDPTAEDDVNNIIATVINIFSVIVGVIAVIMIIVGGIRYVLSGGDSTATTAARNTILFAIVGLVVVALAQIIVRFVLNRVTNPV